MALLLKGAHAVCPATKIDSVVDVLIRDGLVVEVAPEVAEPAKCFTVDCTGKVLIPGAVDVHVHFRDPGFTHKETIETGMRAAARGGFTGVVPMANTSPTCDNAAGIEYVKATAACKPGRTKVYPLGACTVGLRGEELAAMDEMAAAGAMAFSDDGRGIQQAGVMRDCMAEAARLGLPIMSHCQDEGVVGRGIVNEGSASERLGVAGWPACGEELQVAREIQLAKLTGCHIHIQHLTSAAGVEIVRAAKAAGIPVTCEVTPHHLFLCDEDIEADSTSLKMNPPLRTRADMLALQEAFIDGTIDMLATDHAPHAADEKARGLEGAPFGCTGLETALALVLTHLVNPGRMSWQRFVEACAVNPRKLMNIPQVTLAPGSVADFTLLDPHAEWTVLAEEFESKSTNSAFVGARLTGRPTDVFTDGYATLENGKVVM